MKPRPADPAGPSSPPSTVGVVRDGELYSLRELARRLGWHEHALRQARAAGLPMIRFGKEKYILGADVLAFFRRLGERQANGRAQHQAEGIEP